MVPKGFTIELYRWEEERYDRAMVIESADSDDERHKLQYNNGLREHVDLSSETWRYLGASNILRKCDMCIGKTKLRRKDPASVKEGYATNSNQDIDMCYSTENNTSRALAETVKSSEKHETNETQKVADSYTIRKAGSTDIEAPKNIEENLSSLERSNTDMKSLENILSKLEISESLDK